MADKYSKDLQNLAPTSVEPHIYDSHKAFHLVKSKSFIVELLHLFCTKEQIKKEIHKELWVDSHCTIYSATTILEKCRKVVLEKWF